MRFKPDNDYRVINKVINVRQVYSPLQEFKSANKHINVSFITKHTRFMIAKNEIFGQLPIYDSVLSKNLMKISILKVYSITGKK